MNKVVLLMIDDIVLAFDSVVPAGSVYYKCRDEDGKIDIRQDQVKQIFTKSSEVFQSEDAYKTLGA